MGHDLVKIVRTKNGHPIGVVYAVGRGKVGWSLTNKKDRWNKQKGILIAKGRAINGFNGEIPSLVIEDFNAMWHRSERYYK